ncbi:uncharacterized protein RAG0_06174 [Rhynchosporium agropyri]|uniref:Uncharacterized protein n=1 Tax=Rhynchosporium agropyri TaxID=914238 RepID=A0A1E1KG85_9HELO|nr:uncharacterized protein RAG0_06174 [Rhynchosporium agropyri]
MRVIAIVTFLLLAATFVSAVCCSGEGAKDVVLVPENVYSLFVLPKEP